MLDEEWSAESTRALMLRYKAAVEVAVTQGADTTAHEKNLADIEAILNMKELGEDSIRILQHILEGLGRLSLC
jgi:hypothetical protein